MIQKVYGEFAVYCATAFYWYNEFSEERESICDGIEKWKNDNRNT